MQFAYLSIRLWWNEGMEWIQCKMMWFYVRKEELKFTDLLYVIWVKYLKMNVWEIPFAPSERKPIWFMQWHVVVCNHFSWIRDFLNGIILIWFVLFHSNWKWIFGWVCTHSPKLKYYWTASTHKHTHTYTELSVFI